MNIPENFQEIIQKSVEKDINLKTMFRLASLTGNKALLSSITTIAIASSFSQIINPAVPDALYPAPVDKDFNGDFLLGAGIDYTPRIDINQFVRHVLISGSSGAGKTNDALFLIKNFHDSGKKSLHLGFKRSIRYLSREIPILVLIAGPTANFYWSILDAPPGVNQLIWDQMVIKIFCESQFIAEAGESMLLSAVSYLRKNYHKVDFFLLYQHISALKVKAVRELNWKASIDNRLLAFLTMCGSMLKVQGKFPLEKLIADFNIELELDRAGEFKSFIANLFTAYLYLHRISNNIRGSSLITPILCDELNDLVNKSIERHCIFEPTILQLLRVAREFGLGVIFFTNEPTAIPNTIKAQTSTKAIMHTVNWPDIEDMGRSMNLTEEQMELCQDLPVGVAIFKLSELKHSFLVQFPLIEVRKDLTDEGVNENNRNLLAGTEFESMLWKHEDMPIPLGDWTQEEEPKEEKVSVQVAPEEKSFLVDVYNHEFTPIMARFKSLNLSAGTGSRLVKSLVSRNLLRKREVSLGGRGNSITLLKLTDEAYQLLGLPPKQYGRGSELEHYFWQVKYGDDLKSLNKEWQVKIEDNIKDKFIDVTARLQDGRIVAIEIEISTLVEHIVEQIKKDIAVGCDVVCVGIKNKNTLEQLKAIINASQNMRDKTKLCLLPDLLKAANEII